MTEKNFEKVIIAADVFHELGKAGAITLALGVFYFALKAIF